MKIIEEGIINKICCCDLNIEHNEFEKIKCDSRLKEYENIKYFRNNKKGKTIINSTLSFYYNYKKYNSIKGRRGLMGKIFSNIINNGEYVILFGEKNLGKIDFTESLCVFLYERKMIKSYKIFRIYSEIDYKYMECILSQRYEYNKNNNINKTIIIIKFDNENDLINYQYFNQIYQKFMNHNCSNNYYFIFIFDIKEEENKIDNDKKVENYANYFKNHIRNIDSKNILYAGFNTLKNKLLYQEKNFEKNIIKNISQKNIIENDLLYFFYFLIYNMPSGLPDCFLELIFDNYNEIKYDRKLIVKSKIDNWNIINNKKQFDEIFKENKSIEICCKYIFKTLKLYAIILNYFINKNRKRVNRRDGIIHYIYNSYSYKNIWKCKIENTYRKILKKNINNEDFNIYKHKQNILSLINLVICKINFFRELKEKKIAEQIDNYIESILLLFSSYFFQEKDNIQILQICIGLYKKLDKNLNKKRDNLIEKLLLFLYSIDENKDEILKILNNKESNIKPKLKEEIIFLKEIRNKDNNIDNLQKLINKNTSEDIKINIYHEIAAIYFKNKDYINSIYYLKKILNSKIKSDFIKFRIILDYYHAFIKIYKKEKNNNFFKIDEKIKCLNKAIKNSIQKDMYYESQDLKKELYKLIEPDIVMLNSNPLKKISNYIYPLNNQYHILNELQKGIKTHIRIKSNILNNENLYEALNGKGEILIIQLDDFIDNDNIICESEKGKSYLLSFDNIINMIKQKKIYYKVVILCFSNSSFLKKYLDNKHILYNYLITFDYLNLNSYDYIQLYNKTCIQFLIDFIKNSINNSDIEKLFENTKRKFIDNIQDTNLKFYYDNNLNLSTNSTNNIKIEFHKEIDINKIFSYYPIPELDIVDNEILDSNYFSSLLYDLIEEIKLVNKKIFYCNESNKDFVLKLSIEAIKFYYRHKTYYELFCIDIKNGDKKYLKSLIRRLYKTFIEDEEDNKSNDDINEEDENDNKQKNCFILIYNCSAYDLIDIDIYSILKSNNSFIIIYDNEKFEKYKKTNSNNKDIKENRENELNLNYFFIKYGDKNIKQLDDKFFNSNMIKEEIGENFDIKNLKSYLINNKLEIFKNGNLYQYIKNMNISNKKEIFKPIFEEEDIMLIFYKILKIVENLHNNKLYNFNLKLSNIMLDGNYNPIFIDFSTSKKCGEKLNNSDIIKHEYSSPEFYSENLKYDEFKLDSFSLGILLFTLRFGNEPFTIPLNNDDLFIYIKNGYSSIFWEKIKMKYNVEVTDEFKYLFINLVSDNPNNRYSIEDILSKKYMKEIVDKSEKFKYAENQVINKFERIKYIIKIKNKKLHIINENKYKLYKLDNNYAKIENQLERRNPDVEYDNIIQIFSYIEPNFLMSGLYNFLMSNKSELTNIDYVNDKFKIIITEKNENKSNQYNNLFIQYSIRLYQNINNYYYFLKINYIHGNIKLFYNRIDSLRKDLESLTKKGNIINIIYKCDKFNYNKEINIFGEKFVSNNRNRCKIIYNNREYELKSKFKMHQKKNLKIKLKIISNLTNMKGMFYQCINLISLPDIHLIDTSKVKDMSFLFYGCRYLQSLPDISQWNTSNVTNMNSLFSNCNNLESLPDLSKWNTNKVEYMNSLFYNCNSLNSLPDISKWYTNNVKYMNSLFYNCYSIKSLPDISKWNIINVKEINSFFFHCTSLKSLPDISKWNTNNIYKMNSLFSECSALKFLPDLSQWNISHVNELKHLFYYCSSLISLFDISKWNVSNIVDMSLLFCGCTNLLSLPDISNWNTEKIVYINSLFKNCRLLKSLPDISKWNTSELEDMNSLFYGCTKLISLPDISK